MRNTTTLLAIWISVFSLAVACNSRVGKAPVSTSEQDHVLIKKEILFSSANHLRPIYHSNYQLRDMIQLVDIETGCLKLFDQKAGIFQSGCHDSLRIDAHFLGGTYMNGNWVFSSGFEDRVDLVSIDEQTKAYQILEKRFYFADFSGNQILGSRPNPAGSRSAAVIFDLATKQAVDQGINVSDLVFGRTDKEIIFSRYVGESDSVQLGIYNLTEQKIESQIVLADQELLVICGLFNNQVLLSDANRNDLYSWDLKTNDILKIFDGSVYNPVILREKKKIAFTSPENEKSYLVILPLK